MHQTYASLLSTAQGVAYRSGYPPTHTHSHTHTLESMLPFFSLFLSENGDVQ